MSTGLDAFIEERPDGFYFGIERWDEREAYNVEGPFATVADLARAFQQHANPGGFSVDLTTTTHDEFERQWDAVRP
jgi:hypothetical protein